MARTSDKLLFKKALKKAGAKDQWLIVSALRGPDNIDNRAKQFTIAIRRAALLPNDTHHEYSFDMEYYGYPDSELLMSFSKQPEHWKDHVKYAMEAAFKLGILDKTGREMAGLLGIRK